MNLVQQSHQAKKQGRDRKCNQDGNILQKAGYLINLSEGGRYNRSFELVCSTSDIELKLICTQPLMEK